MNQKLVPAILFAAVAGTYLAAVPASADTKCADQMRFVKEIIDRGEYRGMDLAKLHYEAAEQASKSGDEMTCLTEVNEAAFAMLGDRTRTGVKK